jgi:hypothetical protein
VDACGQRGDELRGSRRRRPRLDPGRVTDLFERKGHKFAELDLLLVANDTRPVQHVRHTLVYEIATRD